MSEQEKLDKFLQLNIVLFLHCRLCLEEMPKMFSPMDWAETSIGWTKEGLQLWCNRHDKNILHMDFEGEKIASSLQGSAHFNPVQFKNMIIKCEKCDHAGYPEVNNPLQPVDQDDDIRWLKCKKCGNKLLSFLLKK